MSAAPDPMSAVALMKSSVIPVEEGPVTVKAVPVEREAAFKVKASVVVPVKVWVQVLVP
ncbi:MAG: hypothetical protein ACD_30C00115G0002 [uncultured bacterium]|nr:MAG: hypothetical protein ACD_30C00115G0002 [uncultured bacterium]